MLLWTVPGTQRWPINIGGMNHQPSFKARKWTHRDISQHPSAGKGLSGNGDRDHRTPPPTLSTPARPSLRLKAPHSASPWCFYAELPSWSQSWIPHPVMWIFIISIIFSYFNFQIWNKWLPWVQKVAKGPWVAPPASGPYSWRNGKVVSLVSKDKQRVLLENIENGHGHHQLGRPSMAPV